MNETTLVDLREASDWAETCLDTLDRFVRRCLKSRPGVAWCSVNQLDSERFDLWELSEDRDKAEYIAATEAIGMACAGHLPPVDAGNWPELTAHAYIPNAANVITRGLRNFRPYRDDGLEHEAEQWAALITRSHDLIRQLLGDDPLTFLRDMRGRLLSEKAIATRYLAERAVAPAVALKTPKRKQKANGPTLAQRQAIAEIIQEYGRNIPGKRIEVLLDQHGKGMRKQTRLAILREMKDAGRWSG